MGFSWASAIVSDTSNRTPNVEPLVRQRLAAMMAASWLVRDLQSIRSVAAAVTAAVVFGLVWLLRFNDPGGSFAGLTDDHFFYLIRGWQILFGDLPVRDFVDHGAPLYYYVGAAVQTIGGRGTLSEIAFSSAMLALSAALIFWLCGARQRLDGVGLRGRAVLRLPGAALLQLPEVPVLRRGHPAAVAVRRPPERSHAAVARRS